MVDSFELILKNISKHIILNKEEEEFFVSLLHEVTFKPKEFALKEGQIAQSLYFVTEGCLRYYNEDTNGVIHISLFAPPDWWIGDLQSHHTHQGSHFYIDAIMATKALSLNYEDLDKLYEKVPKFERFFRIMIEKNWVANQNRLIDAMSNTAEQRYDKFLLRYPMLVNTIAQKHIAAYVGVTPEFLSKMRSRKRFKK
jgi:CRP-like cAMP-binding protein